MIQVAHIYCYNPETDEEEILKVTSGRHFYFDDAPYLPVIKQKLSYSEHLIGAGTIDGPATVGVGDLVLVNNGRLDYLTSYAFDGRKILVYLPDDENDTRLDETTLYFTGMIKHAIPGFSDWTISVRNRMEELNVPMTTAVFAGTNVGAGAAGGFEGSESALGGKTKLQLFGRCMAAEGALVNEFFLVYALNYDKDGDFKPIHKVYNVYVKGIPYYPSSDYVDAPALIAATIPTGYYATCLASGLIRLGSTPAGQVVADVADAPDTACSAGQVVQRMLQDNMDYIAGTDYDAGGITYLDSQNPCPTGYQITGNTTVATSVTDVLSSIGAWISPDGPGMFRFGLLDKVDIVKETTGQAAVLNIVSSMYGVDIQRSPTGDQSENIPATKVTLNHTKCWKTQEAGSLADAVSQELKTFLGLEYRAATVTNDTIKEHHPLAPALSYDTFLNQPLQAPLVNGNFSVDLSNTLSGWTFGNSIGGTGVVTQNEEGVSLVPNGATCYITQTLAGPDAIFPGDWQLVFTVPAGYAVNVTVVQDVTTLVNNIYAVDVHDQDIIIPFTMSSLGVQEVVVTFTTVDSSTIAKITTCAILQTIAPLAPILAGMINGNFNTALPSGWTFSGGGAAAILNSILTITPSVTVGQIAQTISTPQIWPGHWQFVMTLKTASSVTITIQQGATVLTTKTYATSGSDVNIVMPFTMLSTGTQSITVILATVDNVTLAKFYDAALMLNQYTNSYANVLNSTFNEPLSNPNNGWTFSGGGTYSQGPFRIILQPSGTDCKIKQTLQIPNDIGVGYWQMRLSLSSGSTSITIRQGSNVVYFGTVNASSDIGFAISSFGATTLTITLSSVGLANVTITSVSISKSKTGSGITYASLINGDFFVALAASNWTYANDAGGTGTYRLLPPGIIMTPVSRNAQISQTLVMGVAINAGIWNLNFVVGIGTSVIASTMQNGLAITTQTFVADTDDVPVSMQFAVVAGYDVTVVFRTSKLSKAQVKNVSLTTSDFSALPVYASLINGAFDVPIVNLSSGWNFSSTAGKYTQVDGVFSLVPEGGVCTIQQSVAVTVAAWTLNLTLKAATTILITIVQNGTTLATETVATPLSLDTDIEVPFTIDDSTYPISVVISTIDTASTCSIDDVVVQQVQIGLSPEEEAQRRLDIVSTLLKRYLVTIPIRYSPQIRTGNIATLTSPRFQLQDGLDFIVVGKEDDHDAEKVTVDLWRDGD